ncbi:hypothetical protein MIND_00854400 [Mycena indigotica]|uniref:Uncharacterized protein n=1 Tax=Mycena indigotica TaxID=2126181 RepID=A0A8H6SGH2_9AGAR|nr:uncharacterized protein MIND_00854400 [Mycena indigotica]KAF7299061.1 hypothetical protein MIND_00854400 [Mycena indigotica]
MGFFTSRKDEPKENTHFRPPIPVETGFKSLRSRLQGYGRKRDSPQTMFSQPSSVAQTLSPPIATPIANRQLQLKLSSSSPALRNPNPAPNNNSKPAKSSNGSMAANANRRSMQPPSSSPESTDTRNPASRSRALGTKTSSSSLITPPKQSDNITATLAQRLNELAVANSEGLLDDDEYRLLRQDLFERFTSTNVVPTETPVVPIASHQRSVRISTATTGKRPSIDSARVSISTSSNFVIDRPTTSYAPSTNSRSSISGVASLFRRATGRQSSSRDDASSVYSSTSAVGESAATRIKRLSKKKSNSSLNTDRGDAVSISSRRTGTSLASPVEPSGTAPSVRSIRKLPMPPSSFPTRLPGVESRYAGMSADPPPTPGADDPESAQALRKEIQAVEAEARRLLDAFNGLELSTLTKHRRTSAMGPRDSVATLIPGQSHQHSLNVSDTASMRSATSAGTSASRTSRHKAKGPMSMHGYSSRSDSGYATSSLRGGTLDRKNSVSSMGSSRLGIGPRRAASDGTTNHHSGGLAPPVPPLPLGMSLGPSSTSTTSLVRSTMGVVHEDEPILTVDLDEERAFGQEMDDLRRRREEVAGRYETRLEYLRAKLRGAELHEKLMSR